MAEVFDTEYIDPNDEYQYSASSFDMSQWKRLFAFARPYKREIWFLMLFSAVTALVDLSFPVITQLVIDETNELGGETNFLFWLLIYIGAAFCLSVSVAGFIWLVSKVRVYTSHDIRREAFSNLQRQSFSYFDQRPVGWIVARLTSDCERLTNILAWGLMDMIWGTSTMLCVSLAMFYYHWKLALIVLAILPLLIWVSAKLRVLILDSARDVRATNSQITAAFNEHITGVRTSKAFTRESINLREFQRLTSRMYNSSVRNLVISAIYVPILLVAASIGYSITLSYGGSELLAGTISTGVLIAAMMLVQYFFEPIELVGHWFAELQMAQASLERVLSVIDAKPQITDSETVTRRIEEHSDRPRSALVALDGFSSMIKNIDVQSVHFKYKADDEVLTDINVTIHSNETIAIVGPTGGGKSTLVNVICRFYEPTKGKVLIDGIDYRERSLHWLHNNLGIVLQHPHVFSGTIRENIRYGHLPASDNDVQRVAELVGADSFIELLPQGYDTQVGESGGRLSSGQKQLISYARAVLANPQILILDEATSSVDTETERKIQRSLEHLLQGRISIVIAHRLSTVQSADRILYLDGGKIVETGTHESLLQLNGYYARLLASQQLGSDLNSDDMQLQTTD